MTYEEIEENLDSLLELIYRERECVRDLKPEALEEVNSEKESLLAKLEGLDEIDVDDDLVELAQTVREENKHNAYLLWAGLKMVRDTMGFFDDKLSEHGYVPPGQSLNLTGGGKLLSGKV